MAHPDVISPSVSLLFRPEVVQTVVPTLLINLGPERALTLDINPKTKSSNMAGIALLAEGLAGSCTNLRLVWFKRGVR